MTDELCIQTLKRAGFRECAAHVEKLIERLDVNGIHSCHTQCQRPACVARRERDTLKAALDKALEENLRLRDETEKSPASPDRSITRGCVVMMASSSGMPGYGNQQCVSGVNDHLGTVSLFGHNEHYSIMDVRQVVEFPSENQPNDQR